jgi:molecular chaperone GrpE
LSPCDLVSIVGTVSDGSSETSRPPSEPPQPSADPPGPEAELAKLREERDRIKDQLLRTAADFDNFRKRTQKDLAEERRRAKEDAIRELLPVIDNLERAVSAATGASEVGAIVEGVRMVLKLFEDQAARLGLTKVASVGERFDPAVHDAIQQVETDEHPPGTVISEVVAGFRLGDKLVRPAMVVVARKPPAA